MLKLVNIKKDYFVADTKVEALKGLDICFRQNEFVSILGPSGCGKTTLLNIIGGLDKYSDGDLFINGVSTKEFTDRNWDVYRNHRIGFIFQSYNLIPHQTVLSNVELALTIAGLSKNERVERAKKALDRVGLSSQYNKKPNQLSGGQCQRVAIARALVNEPEILLADEPTGALDTETSVQIMDLIKEIANERLVIMVTHNPDLANKYSTRIVNLLDGKIINDSNPFSVEEETKEIEDIKEKEAKLYEEGLANIDSNDPKAVKEYNKNRNAKEKAKMSFWTAFKLSAKNLWSKRGRTIMVGFAGSIGIIGVTTVLAVSQGVSNYIENMQDDLLSGNPIAVTKSGIDYETLINSSSFLTQAQATTKGYEKGKINVNSQIEYLVSNQKALESLTFNNEFNKDYVDYIKSMPTDYYNAIKLNYGLDLNYSIYTHFEVGEGSDLKKNLNGSISLNAINQIYTKALSNMEGYGKYADLITGLTSPLSQAVPNNDYILSQYDLIDGSMPKGENDILLVLDKNSMMSDLMLAQMGFYTQEEFYGLVYHTINNMTKAEEGFDPVKDAYRIYDESKYKPTFTNKEIFEKEFTWYPNNSNFIFKNIGDFDYKYKESDITNKNGAIKLKITGIVRPKEDISYGALQSGFLYSEDLARTIITKNINSFLVTYIKAMTERTKTSYIPSTISYNLDYYWEKAENGTIYPMGYSETEAESKIPAKTTVNVGSTEQTSQISSIISSGGSSSFGDMSNIIEGLLGTVVNAINADPSLSAEQKLEQINGARRTITQFAGMLSTMLSDKRLYAHKFGGSYLPQSIRIYPKNFATKDKVTNYLSDWNKIEGKDAKAVTFNAYSDTDFTNPIGTKTLEAVDRQEIKYTDSVGLIIGLIKTMINIVTYALVAFTALSLVVSTVMIAIITYVSVMERIKEIGVIRSLGGRKKDVSHLFNAETFIIGFGSGVLGIVVTYLLTIIINLIVRVLSSGSVTTIATLTPTTALIMIAVSIVLTSISGLIPARSAAKKDPVIALRTE